MLKIKTKCGIEKYQHLKKKKGLLNRIRMYWFFVIAVIRDSLK